MPNHLEEKTARLMIFSDAIRDLGTMPIDSEDDAYRIGREIQNLAAKVAGVGVALVSDSENPNRPASPMRPFGRR